MLVSEKVQLSAIAASQLRGAGGEASAAPAVVLFSLCIIHSLIKELDMTGMYPVLEVNPRGVYLKVLKKHIKRKE